MPMALKLLFWRFFIMDITKITIVHNNETGDLNWNVDGMKSPIHTIGILEFVKNTLLNPKKVEKQLVQPVSAMPRIPNLGGNGK